MSDHHPLLCDELIEEERFSPQFHRRLLMSRARARNKVKGAAAIITRWPDHWSSLLTYWWLGIGMIAVTTFLIYNFLFSYAMLQSTNTFAPKTYYVKPKARNSTHTSIQTSKKLKVLMHLFPDDNQDLDWDMYLPYIDILTNSYTNFQYEIIIVANDTDIGGSVDESKNNDQALKKIWTGKYKYQLLSPTYKNLKLKFVSLPQYLHKSPLKKCWKKLPYQFIKFLVRAISIWDKGGIAFDPILLTPHSPHPLYADKINKILKNINSEKNGNEKIQKHENNIKLVRKFNNIREIINALSDENDDPIDNKANDSLLEAESDNVLTVIKPPNGMSTLESNFQELQPNESNESESNHEMNTEAPVKKGIFDMLPKTNLLPLFLDYLFRNKGTQLPEETTDNFKISSNETTPINKNLTSKVPLTNKEDDYKPVIISAKNIIDTGDVTKADDSLNKIHELIEVSIDLKGKLIATNTPCHAFIGGMFANAIHHDRSESVTDFIIKELSVFCKGLLASCMGIDVILL